MTKEKKNNGRLPTRRRPRPPTVMNDSWLLDLVDDPKTDRALSELMVEEAVEKRGMAREEAERAFLPAPRPGKDSPVHTATHARPGLSGEPRSREPEIEVEDLLRMTSDILNGKAKPHIETEAGWEAWQVLEREIEEIKSRGGVVDFPAI